MSVMPGFGGQAFQPVAWTNYGTCARPVSTGLVLSIDGGVKAENVALCTEAGADLLVIGTGLIQRGKRRLPIPSGAAHRDRPEQARLRSMPRQGEQGAGGLNT